ncbi:MAG: lysophospholipase [Myxococcales bacterium]|nr:lysophospholipase [Myxococcales bacterium]
MDRGSGTVAGFGGHPVFVRWLVPDGARGGVLVSHGYSEHSGRYEHVMEQLASVGLASMVPDHRGHGHTATVPGYIEDAELVIADLGVVHRALMQRVRGPIFGLAHSMGGLFFLRYLERYGDEFAAAVLNAPALRVPDGVPRTMHLVARAVAKVAPTLPLQPFFEPERSTSDEEVLEEVHADPLVYSGWIRAGTGVTVLKLIRQTLRDLHQIRIPLLITHGSADLRVPLTVSQEVAKRVSSTDVEVVVFDGLRHETHNDVDRQAVLERWSGWLEERL